MNQLFQTFPPYNLCAAPPFEPKYLNLEPFYPQSDFTPTQWGMPLGTNLEPRTPFCKSFLTEKETVLYNKSR